MRVFVELCRVPSVDEEEPTSFLTCFHDDMSSAAIKNVVNTFFQIKNPVFFDGSGNPYLSEDLLGNLKRFDGETLYVAENTDESTNNDSVPWNSRVKSKESILKLMHSYGATDGLGTKEVEDAAVQMEEELFQQCNDDVEEYAFLWSRLLSRLYEEYKDWREKQKHKQKHKQKQSMTSKMIAEDEDDASPRGNGADGSPPLDTLDSLYSVVFQLPDDLTGISHGVARSQPFKVSARDVHRLQWLRSITGLEDYSVTDLLRHFLPYSAEVDDVEDCLDLETFALALLALPKIQAMSVPEQESLLSLFGVLFGYLDLDGNGLIDRDELTSGLAVLCGGSKEDKIALCFMLFDEDRDNALNRREMYRYLRALFRGCISFGVCVERDDVHLDDIEKMESDTVSKAVDNCFEEVDIDGNNLLDLQEFIAWHNSKPKQLSWLALLNSREFARGSEHPFHASNADRVDGGRGGAAAAEEEEEEEEEDSSSPTEDETEVPNDHRPDNTSRSSRNGGSLSPPPPERPNTPPQVDKEFAFVFQGVDGVPVTFTTPDLEKVMELRAETGLGRMNPEEMLKHFYEYSSGDGVIDQNAFQKCILNLDTVRHMFPWQQERLLGSLQKLFEWFDRDGSGTVDFREFTSGLAVLCGGTQRSKLEILFELADEDRDGYLNEAEIYRLMASLYRGIISNATTDAEYVDALEKAVISKAVEECFIYGDLDRDGRISFPEWEKWIRSNPESISWLNLLHIFEVPSVERHFYPRHPPAFIPPPPPARSTPGPLSFASRHASSAGQKGRHPASAPEHSGAKYKSFSAGISRHNALVLPPKVHSHPPQQMDNGKGSGPGAQPSTLHSRVMSVDTIPTAHLLPADRFGSKPLDPIPDRHTPSSPAVQSDSSCEEKCALDLFSDQSCSLTLTEVDLEEISRVSRMLGTLSLVELWIRLRNHSEGGYMSNETFTQVFLENCPSTFSAGQAMYVSKRLFSSCDIEGDGVVDFTELALSLAVYTKGDLSQKIMESFAIFASLRDPVETVDLSLAQFRFILKFLLLGVASSSIEFRNRHIEEREDILSKMIALAIKEFSDLLRSNSSSFAPLKITAETVSKALFERFNSPCMQWLFVLARD